MFEEFYDPQGNCLASENVRPPPKPWVLRQSISKQGRWYFSNPETQATSWGLKPWWNDEEKKSVSGQDEGGGALLKTSGNARTPNASTSLTLEDTGSPASIKAPSKGSEEVAHKPEPDRQRESGAVSELGSKQKVSRESEKNASDASTSAKSAGGIGPSGTAEPSSHPHSSTFRLILASPGSPALESAEPVAAPPKAVAVKELVIRVDDEGAISSRSRGGNRSTHEAQAGTSTSSSSTTVNVSSKSREADSQLPRVHNLPPSSSSSSSASDPSADSEPKALSLPPVGAAGNNNTGRGTGGTGDKPASSKQAGKAAATGRKQGGGDGEGDDKEEEEEEEKKESFDTPSSLPSASLLLPRSSSLSVGAASTTTGSGSRPGLPPARRKTELSPEVALMLGNPIPAASSSSSSGAAYSGGGRDSPDSILKRAGSSGSLGGGGGGGGGSFDDASSTTSSLSSTLRSSMAGAVPGMLSESEAAERGVRKSVRMENNRDAFQKKVERRATLAAAAAPLFLRPEDLFVVGGLGMGGYGVVVQVEHATTRKNYAMKSISKESCQKPKDRKRLKAELRVLSEIEASPFLIRCHLAFESPTTINFVTDLVDGGDLFFHLEWFKEHKRMLGFPEAQGKVILAELVLSLIHLHKHNFVHRDLKIENCMIDANGHVKLIDFGLACELENDVVLLSPSECFLYLPPELLKPGARTRGGVGGRHTDWWALGVLAYEVLTGVSTWNSMEKSAVREEIRELSTSPPPGVSKAAGRFVMSLLKRNYKERLGTANDDEVKDDRFFDGIDWEAMAQGRTAPGFVPEIASGGAKDPEEGENAVAKYKDMRADTSTVDPRLERTAEGRRMSWGSIGLKTVNLNPGFERPERASGLSKNAGLAENIMNQVANRIAENVEEESNYEFAGY